MRIVKRAHSPSARAASHSATQHNNAVKRTADELPVRAKRPRLRTSLKGKETAKVASEDRKLLDLTATRVPPDQSHPELRAADRHGSSSSVLRQSRDEGARREDGVVKHTGGRVPQQGPADREYAGENPLPGKQEPSWDAIPSIPVDPSLGETQGNPPMSLHGAEEVSGAPAVGIVDEFPAAEPPLCQEQELLLDITLSGANVFFTGSAGVGKSTALRAIVRRLRLEGREVSIVAPTGRAALEVNGVTVWAYAGWTPDHMKKPLDYLQKAAHCKFTRRRLRKTDVLVVDEISMVENHLFERLNHVMQSARNDSRPFGGVQIIVTGDFCQLPPVTPFKQCMHCGFTLQPDLAESKYTCTTHGVFHDQDKWAFRSKAWADCDFVNIRLSTIHRQADPAFIAILQKFRTNEPLGEEERAILVNHDADTREAVRLYPTREEVRQINELELKKLEGPQYTYHSWDDFSWNPRHRHLEWKGRRSPHDNTLLALTDHRFESTLAVKKGMPVVLQVNVNIPLGLVNGTQGVVIGFAPMAEEDTRIISEKWRQAELTELTRSTLIAPTVRGKYAYLKEENIRVFMKNCEDQLWPVVRFNNGQVRTIHCDCHLNELGDDEPYTLISRTQLPLLPAWAMTIHKAQGMTLDRVVVDLSKCFEYGQLYVAVSRVRSLSGLKVTGLDGAWQHSNEQVRDYLMAQFGSI